MNRMYVKLSALGGVVLSAGLGLAQLTWGGNGAEAPDASAGVAAANTALDPSSGTESVAPTKLVPQQSRRDSMVTPTNGVAGSDPFSRGRAPAQISDSTRNSAYDEREPARFEPGGKVNPLRFPGEDQSEPDSAMVRTTAGENSATESMAENNATTATDINDARPSDPFKTRAKPGAAGKSNVGPSAGSAYLSNTANLNVGAEAGSQYGRPPRDQAQGSVQSSVKTTADARFQSLDDEPSPSVMRGGVTAPVAAKPESKTINNSTGMRRPAILQNDPLAGPSRSVDDSGFEAAPLNPSPTAASNALPSTLSASSLSPASVSPAAASRSGVAGNGRPGPRQLEGKQAPQLLIEKIAPAEIQVGKQARFEIRIRNAGSIAAQAVEVHDMVPEGTQFVSATPPANPGVNGELHWSLGTLKPGEESNIELELMPSTEGEVGSVASVSFRSEAAARSRVTKPELTLQVAAVRQVMIGQDVVLSIKISNPGTGPATNVILEERIPAGLKHSAGAELEFEVGTLKPGETRELDLTVNAAQPGRIINRLTARADANLRAEAQCELEVIAPALEISMDGPGRRYLERQATYTVSVSNPGTAPAKDVQLITRLPKGLKFIKANNSGHYDAASHSVSWSLDELPAAETGSVTLTALPIEAGEQRLRAEGRARQGLSDDQEQIIVVEGLAAIMFEVVDIADPIEVKGETTYEVRVVNQGSKAADNVQLVATLPPEMRFVSAEGPTKFANDGGRVVFEPLGRLAPKADTTYRITTQGMQAGDARMRLQLMTDEMRQPVTKEESTRIYADE